MNFDELLRYGREVLSAIDDPDEPGLRGRIAVPPLRSVLYVPGNRRDWIRKCARYGADGIVIDLEDAVQPEEREAARTIVSEEIGPLARQVRSVWVRVNSAPSEMRADLEAAVRPGLSVVQIAKTSRPEAVVAVDRLVGWLEGRNGVAFGTVAINPLLETANGVRDAFAIAMCSPRVEYVGSLISPEGDTARALRMRAMSDRIGSESLHIRSKVALDARAAGIRYPLGGVVTDLRPDHETLRGFAEANRNMGYSGMLVIHPSHVPVVNEIFSPTAAELKRSLRILDDLKSSSGRGAIRDRDNGGMIDLAMARFAVLVLEEARELGIDVAAAAP